jgi:hypothetical protein
VDFSALAILASLCASEHMNHPNFLEKATMTGSTSPGARRLTRGTANAPDLGLYGECFLSAGL